MKKHYTIRPLSIVWWVKIFFEFIVVPALFLFLLLGYCWILS